ncbi:hypothetical protein NL676_017703 [Syzygium grande]|nr:hypothetical protein NL676_017703 [Syzygium grande]
MITDRVLARLRGRTCDEQNPRLVQPDEIGKIGIAPQPLSPLLVPIGYPWAEAVRLARILLLLLAFVDEDLRYVERRVAVGSKRPPWPDPTRVPRTSRPAPPHSPRPSQVNRPPETRKGAHPNGRQTPREREREGEGEAERPRPGLAVDLAIAQIWATARSTAGHGKAELDPPNEGDWKIQKREMRGDRSLRGAGASERAAVASSWSERAKERLASRETESLSEMRDRRVSFVPNERDGQQSSERVPQKWF